MSDKTIKLPASVYNWIRSLASSYSNPNSFGTRYIISFHGALGSYDIIQVRDEEYFIDEQKKLDKFEEVSYYDDGEHEWIMMKKSSSGRLNKKHKKNSKKKSLEQQLNAAKKA